MCRIATPIFAFFAVQLRIWRKFHRYFRTRSQRPSCKCQHWNCVSALFVISCEIVPDPVACGTDPRFFVVRKGEFLDDDLGVKKIDFQKRFPVIPTYSVCQETSVCRGSAWNENLESLLVDWKRKTVSHCNLIPLLEIVPKHS